MGREYQSTSHHGHRLAARVLLCILLALLFLLAPASPAQDTSSPASSRASVRVMTLDGPIGPALSDWFVRSLEKANEASATLFVLQLNTPGGLDSAMRDMIRAILDSRVPLLRRCHIQHVPVTIRRGPAHLNSLLQANHSFHTLGE